MDDVLQESQRLTREGRIEAARQLLEVAIETAPENSALLQALGRVYLLCNLPHDAARVLQAALIHFRNRRTGFIAQSSDDPISDEEPSI